MSAMRRAQFVPMGMPIICWKTFPVKTTTMFSTRNSSIIVMSSSVYLLFEPECFLTKKGPSRPKTIYLYLRFPFLWMKELINKKEKLEYLEFVSSLAIAVTIAYMYYNIYMKNCSKQFIPKSSLRFLPLLTFQCYYSDLKGFLFSEKT